jgi:heme oxygenase (mycobilin-producing)
VIVVTNRIRVASGHESEFEDRFRSRAQLVDRSPGFIRNEVHRPRPMRFDRALGEYVPDPSQPAFYEVKTWWRSFQDFEDWTRSPAFTKAHESKSAKDGLVAQSEVDVHEVFLESPASGNL